MSKFVRGAIYASLLIFCYLVLAAFLSSFIVSSTEVNKINVDKSIVYSESDIARSDQKMKEILQQARKDDEGKSFADIFSKARTRVLFLSWIPWLVFPFVLSRKVSRSFWFWMGVLFVQSAGWVLFFTTLELVVFSLTLGIGLILSAGINGARTADK